MTDLPDNLLYEGVSIDIAFADPRPWFGDLFLICGASHPRFPPTGSAAFGALADLQFDQVDDYFGVRSLGDEGDDVVVWLYPLVAGKPIHHHAGPFDGVRLEYCILRGAPHTFSAASARLLSLAVKSITGTVTPTWERRPNCLPSVRILMLLSSTGRRRGSPWDRTTH